MRIFNIMMSRDLGGIQQVYIDYSEALRMQSHEVINISSIGAEINNLLNNDYALPNIMPRCIISKIYLQSLIAKHEPDTIICHGNRAISFSTAFSFLCKRKIPIIGVSHNYSYKYLAGCDYILTLTKKLKQHLIDKGIDKTKLSEIPNMTRVVHDYQPMDYHSPVIIGSFGRFVENKGFKYLIEAISILKENNCNVRLLLGGSGDSESENLLRVQVTRLGLEDCVTFDGWVKDKDEFFKRIDIFCSPSIVEPFGVIPLEAMARSAPIIATKSGGPEETITDGKDGIVVDIKSPKALSDALQRLISDEKLGRSLSKAAYSKVKDYYDIAIVSKKLSDIIREF